MNLKTLIALAVAAFAVPVAASAAGDNPAAPQSGGAFDRLDANHDGYVSRDEARNANELNARFSEFDRDNNGMLSRQEYNAVEADQRAQGHGPGRPGHRSAAGATSEERATAGKAPDKQPSQNPRSESGITK
jgi:hypothetical protein